MNAKKVTINQYLDGTASKQEVFDYAISKVLEQGKPCATADGMCVYQGENGMRCAIGWLLDNVDPAYEGHGPGFIVASIRGDKYFTSVRIESYDNRPEVKFLNDLQRVHDEALRSCFVADLRCRAAAFADKYGLNIDILRTTPTLPDSFATRILLGPEPGETQLVDRDGVCSSVLNNLFEDEWRKYDFYSVVSTAEGVSTGEIPGLDYKKGVANADLDIVLVGLANEDRSIVFLGAGAPPKRSDDGEVFYNKISDIRYALALRKGTVLGDVVVTPTLFAPMQA